jgi:hypothetical protein
VKEESLRMYFLEGVLELFVVGGVDGIEAAEHHRLHVLEAGQRGGGGLVVAGDGVADLDLGGLLDVGDDVAALAGAELLVLERLGVELADFLDVVHLVGAHHADAVAGLERAVDHAHVGDHAAVGVVMGVEHQGAGLGEAADGRGHALDHGLEHLADVLARLGADEDGLLHRDGEHVLDLLA